MRGDATPAPVKSWRRATDASGMRVPRAPRRLPSILAALAILPCAWPADAGPGTPRLVPAPARIQRFPGAVQLDSSWSIVLADQAADEAGARLLARDLFQSRGWKWRIGGTRSTGSAVMLEARPHDSGAPHSEQGYTLAIEPSLIRVSASTAVGRFYGLQTLRQIVRQAEGASIPRLLIEDAPSFGWRGVSDDISRGQLSRLADFRARLEELAYYKINLVLLYMEDVYTQAPGSGDALAPQELGLIARAAARYHIRLVPVFQALGYTPSVVRALSSGRPGTRTPPFSDAGMDSVLERVDAIAAALPGPWFHIGGDELGTFGLADSEGREISKKGSTHLAYVASLSRHLRERGRTTLVYGDFVHLFPHVLDSLARNTIVVDWSYHPGADCGTAARLRRAGFDSVMVSPGLWNWSTFYPNYGRAFQNVASFIDTGRAAGAIGTVTSAWGDNGSESLRASNLLGYAFGAAASWEAARPGDVTFLRAYAATRFGIDSEALADAERRIGWRDLKVPYAGPVFHRRPHVREAGDEWQREMTAIRSDMTNARAAIRDARAAARWNALELEELDHAARRWEYIADRELALTGIAATLRTSPGPQAQSAAAASLESLRVRLAEIAAEYERLWRMRNRPSGLEWNLGRLRRQMDQIAALRDLARDGRLEVWKPRTHGS